MSERLALEARVEPVEWGRATNTLLRLPDDVALALRHADQTAVWEGLTAGKRRGLLYQIGTAKTAPTRAKRIDALIKSLT